MMLPRHSPRTSKSDPLRIAEVPCGGSGGALGVTLCPGKCGHSVFGAPWQRDLSADLDVVQAWGAEAVLTLVEHHELELLGVPDLGRLVRDRGIQWYHLPIPDLEVPSGAFERGWHDAGQVVRHMLRRGGRVLVHCRGGRGRAGTVAACILVELGASAAEAIRLVRGARRGAIETREQERYVAEYALR